MTAVGTGSGARHSVLAQHRRRVHIALRGAVRLWQVTAPPAYRGRAPRARLVAGAAADVVVAGRMRSLQEPNWPRLFVDVVEAAVWAAAAPDTADGSRPVLLSCMSLALESGVRDGPGGLIVPAAVGGAVLAVRARRDHALRPSQLLWPAAAALGGWALSRYEESRRAEVRRELEQHRAARAAAGFRAGQLEAAAEADSIIDEVQRACVLVEDDGGPSVRAAVGAWKASLAESVRADAAFLSDALLQWQTLHNLHADLRTAIRFELDHGHMTVLSRRQCDDLWRALEGLAINGSVAVVVEDTRMAAVPGRERRLRIGGHLVVISEDAAPPRHVDILPPQLLMSALLLSIQSFRDLGAVRRSVAFSGAAAYAAIAVWAHRTLPETGAAGRARSGAAALAVTSVYSVVATRTAVVTTTTSGAPMFPFEGAAEGMVAIVASVFSSLTPAQKRASIAGCAVSFLAGWAVSPQRREWRHLIPGSAWTLAYAGVAGGLSSAIDTSVDQLVTEMRAEEERAVAEGLELGRQWVRYYADAVVDAARTRFEEIGPRLDAGQRAEAERRLRLLQHRLVAGSTT